MATGVDVDVAASLGPVPTVRITVPLLLRLYPTATPPSSPQSSPKQSKSQKQKLKLKQKLNKYQVQPQPQQPKQRGGSGHQRGDSSSSGADHHAGIVGRPCQLVMSSKTVYGRIWIHEHALAVQESTHASVTPMRGDRFMCSVGCAVWRSPTRHELVARATACGYDAPDAAGWLTLWPARLPRATRIIVQVVPTVDPSQVVGQRDDPALASGSLPYISAKRVATILANVPVCTGCTIDDVYFQGIMLLRVCSVEIEVDSATTTNIDRRDTTTDNGDRDGAPSHTDAMVHRTTLVEIRQPINTNPHESTPQSQPQPPMSTPDPSPPLIGIDSVFHSILQLATYPLKYKQSLDTLRIQVPKAILLSGPPGVGKTSVVGAVARACQANLFVIQGAEIFGSYLGQSEERLRARFNEALESSHKNPAQPSILFIDEIDVLAPKRDNGGASRDASVVAQLLTLMDGIGSGRMDRLVVIGATNRPGAIDPALRRPGRFDREVVMDAPIDSVRLEMLQGLTRHLPLADDVNLAHIATATRGFVGADLAALCREAALLVASRDALSADNATETIAHADFELALARSGGASLIRGTTVSVAPTTWDSIGGLDHIKHKLIQSIEWPLIHHDTFIRLGLRPPRGVLLYGPPGCSKTTLARAVASSASATFFSLHGASLYSPYLGESERIIRSTFQRARSTSPSVIFIDEIDTLVGQRDLGQGGSSRDTVQERVLSALLNEMDGIESANGVLVLGATNRPDKIDAALLRPGRFDRVIHVPPPSDTPSRLAILQVHTRGMPLAPTVDLHAIASLTISFTGADLGNVCREAALHALRDGHREIEQSHFLRSVSNTIPTLSPQMVKQYEMFAATFGE